MTNASDATTASAPHGFPVGQAVVRQLKPARLAWAIRAVT